MRRTGRVKSKGRGIAQSETGDGFEANEKRIRAEAKRTCDADDCDGDAGDRGATAVESGERDATRSCPSPAFVR